MAGLAPAILITKVQCLHNRDNRDKPGDEKDVAISPKKPALIVTGLFVFLSVFNPIRLPII